MLRQIHRGLWCQRQGKKLAELARLIARGQLLPADADAGNDSPDDDEDGADDDVDTLLAQAGLRREGLLPAQQVAQAAKPYHLWPENLPVLALWNEVQTLWLTGPAGATGLDAVAVQQHISRTPLRDLLPPGCRGRSKRRDALAWIWRGLRAMERSTLDAWAQQRKEDEAKNRKK